ncbi:MAG: hypothetical protein K0R47_968, partial [Brevibacillus sp.]|nr:hypothetical protein [Brevibacillus sp.]
QLSGTTNSRDPEAVPLSSLRSGYYFTASPCIVVERTVYAPLPGVGWSADRKLASPHLRYVN